VSPEADAPPDAEPFPEPFVPPVPPLDGAALTAGASAAEAAPPLAVSLLVLPAVPLFEGALFEAPEPLGVRALSEVLVDPLDELVDELSAPWAKVVVDPPAGEPDGPPVDAEVGAEAAPEPDGELGSPRWAGTEPDVVPVPLASAWPPELGSLWAVAAPGGVLTELTESLLSAPGAPARNSGAAVLTDGTIEPSGRITDRKIGAGAAGSWLAAFSTKALPRFCTAANTGSEVGRPPSALKPASEPTATIAPVAPASFSRGDPASSWWWRGPSRPASRCAQPSLRRIAATESPIPMLAA
jgi:hypothetical protein